MPARPLMLGIAWLALSLSLYGEIRSNDWHSLHEQGVRGNKEAVVQCIEQLEQVLEEQPQNQLARAYLGSAYTLRSRDLWIGPQKLESLRHGGALMDQAVAQAPLNPEVRLVRAINSLSLPRIFNRRKIAVEDFKLLVAQAAQPGLDPSQRQAIYYYAGLAQETESQSVELWNKGLEIDPLSSLAQKIRSALNATRG